MEVEKHQETKAVYNHFTPQSKKLESLTIWGFSDGLLYFEYVFPWRQTQGNFVLSEHLKMLQ